MYKKEKTRWIFPFLLFGAITSSKITSAGKIMTTKLLTNLASPISYIGIGVGNDTTAAVESQTGLIGDETKFKNGNVSYYTSGNSSYISSWNSSWVYGDLTTHKYNEIVVCQNASNQSNVCLLRAVFTEVELGSGDSLGITAQISISEG